MSELQCGTYKFPAFSGLGDYVNKRMAVCKEGGGAIPLAAYFIIDRQFGGLLGPFRDTISGKRDWFSLLADDGKIDDVTICNRIICGQFRLHPKGTLGISRGCVVIDDANRFQLLRALLRTSAQRKTLCTSIMTYDRVVVI
ncbi:MAG TPA: DUF2778 domain-containing protein [Noviherbaspirillum sp.]